MSPARKSFVSGSIVTILLFALLACSGFLGSLRVYAYLSGGGGGGGGGGPDPSSTSTSCSASSVLIGKSTTCTASLFTANEVDNGFTITWSQTYGAGSATFPTSCVTTSNECSITVTGTGDGDIQLEASWAGDSSFANSFGDVWITVGSPVPASLEFSESGLDSTAQGLVVTFPTGQFSPINYTEFSTTENGIDTGSIINYSYAQIVNSSNSGERFVLNSPTSPASGFAISGDTTITGSYQEEYYVQFATSPTYDGSIYSQGGNWLDAGSGGNLISWGPYPGYVFTGWSIQCVTGTSCITFNFEDGIQVNGPGTLVANFEPDSPIYNNTSTALSCFGASNSTDYVGGEAACTVVVTDTSGNPSAPTGNVNFSSDLSGTFGPFGSDSGEFVAPMSCTLQTLSLNQSTCTLAYTPASGSEGINLVSATYPGDTSHYGSASSFELTVYDRQTATSVTCTPVTQGTETCTASVMDMSTYDEITPTGQVYFLTSGAGGFHPASGSTYDTAIDGLYNGCTLAANPAGQAPNTLWADCSVTYVASPFDPKYVQTVAVYVGDSNHTTSSGSTSALDSDQSVEIGSYLTYAGAVPLKVHWLASVNGGSYEKTGLCPSTTTSNQGSFIDCSIAASKLKVGNTYSFELTWTDSQHKVYTNLLPTSTLYLFPQLKITLSETSQDVSQGQTAKIADKSAATGTPTYVYEWLEEAPGQFGYSVAANCASPYSSVCKFVTSASTPLGTYNFIFIVEDSATSPEEVGATPTVTVT